ncbi:MAG: phosphatidate cytidylyltransferase [Alphaproteobacteria bacterium]|nr:phosphatidate cytidylyltransferase [Alphaproteobacteria bacterium]
MKRILVSAGMAAAVIGAGVLEYHYIPAVRWLAVLVVMGITAEFLAAAIKGLRNKDSKVFAEIAIVCLAPYALFLGAAAYFVGTKPGIMLLLLLVISAADTGGWFFGKWFGTTKLWQKISPNKTWTGQIAGIICGAGIAILYGILGGGGFMPQLMWIGIAVALLSQYGDLTASWIKRKFGVDDFSRALPGHGGLLDRFDGWIYVLPITWLAMM